MRMQVTTATLPSTLSRTEELANVLTHGLGLLLSLAGAAIMVSLLGHGDSWRIAGCIIYLASLSGVYLMSTLSHTFETPRVRSFFRALDQGTIYFLIAATYTPFSMAYLHSWPWWLFLAVVWGVAMALNLAWPRPEVYGTPWYNTWGAFIYIGIILGSGLLWFAIKGRKHLGTLASHAAE